MTAEEEMAEETAVEATDLLFRSIITASRRLEDTDELRRAVDEY